MALFRLLSHISFRFITLVVHYSNCCHVTGQEIDDVTLILRLRNLNLLMSDLP